MAEDWEDVPAKKPVKDDDWQDVSAKPVANAVAQPGAFQTKKGGKIYTDEAEALKDKQADEKNAAGVTEHAAGTLAPGGEFGVGAAKGTLSTGRNLGALGIKALRMMERQGGPDESLSDKLSRMWPEAEGGAREMLKPQSVPAKVGFGAEQAGEFAIPGGVVTKGMKAAEGIIDAAKVPPIASKALKLLSRGGLEAANAGGVTAAQGGDVKTNALIGGATPFLSAALKPAGEALAEKAAPALANKVLRPVPTQLENAARFGRNPGQAIADEGIVATSHGDLVTRIGDRKQGVGQQIGSMLKTSTVKPVNVAMHIQQPINDAIQDAADGKVEGGEALIAKLRELRDQLMTKRVLQKDGSLKVMGPKRLTLTPDEMHGLKRQIGDATKWSEDSLTQTVNDVKRNIYRNLNEEVQKQVPGVKKLQDRYGNLLEAERAAEREFARHEARNPFSLTDVISGVGAGAAGAAHGGNLLESGLSAVALPAAIRAARSPLVRTAAVQGLKNAPKALSPEFLRFARNAAFGAQSENRQ